MSGIVVAEVGIVSIGTSLDSDRCSVVGRLVVTHIEGDTGLETVGDILVEVGDVLLGGLADQLDSLVDVGHCLGIDLAVGGTGLAGSASESRLGVDRDAETVLVSDVAAGEDHTAVCVSIGADGVGVAKDIVDQRRVTLDLLGSVEDIVDVGDQRIVVVPHIVGTPGAGSVAGLDVVTIVIPEPAVTLCGLDEVFAHKVGHKVVGLGTEALMVVSGGSGTPLPEET